MYLKGWVKVLFLFVLVGFLFASLSFSFASDDLNLDSGFLSSDYEENIDWVANVDVDSSSSSLEDSLNPIFSEDDDSVSPVFVDGDTVFNDVEDCVDNFMEDSRDDGLDEIINPRLDPLDDRVVSQLEVSSFSKYYLNGTQLVGYLKDDDGNPLADRIVSVGIVGVVYNADQRGAYTIFHTLSSSTYVRKSEGGSLISGGQYLVDEVVGTTTKDNIKELIKISSFDLFSNYAYKSFKNQYLSI